MTSPYEEALDFIHRNTDSDSSIGFAKLILSLYKSAHAFGFAECTQSFDETRSNLACRMIAYYLEHGEDEELQQASMEIYKGFADLLELSSAANKSKEAVKMKWRNENKSGGY